MPLRTSELGSARKPGTRTGTVLILDDEKEICQWLKTILIREGYYTCHTVQTADEALDHLSKNEVNLVLADIRLQKQSGLEVLKKTKSDYPETAVVMMSATNQRETAVQAVEQGAYAYLTKPFKASELFITFINALHRQRLENESRRYQHWLEETIHDQTDDIRHSREEIEILRPSGACSRANGCARRLMYWR